MKGIILIRHFLTVENSLEILQGAMETEIDMSRIDYPLLNFQKKFLTRLRADRYFCSPQIRAIQTTELLGINNYTIDHRIREFDFGEFEGCYKNQMIEKVGNFWLKNFTSVTFGEGYKKFSERIDDFLKNEIKDGEYVCLISHGVVLKFILGKTSLIDIDSINQINIPQNNIIVVHLI